MRSTRHPLLLGFDLSLDQKSEKHFFFFETPWAVFLTAHRSLRSRFMRRIISKTLYIRVYVLSYKLLEPQV